MSPPIPLWLLLAACAPDGADSPDGSDAPDCAEAVIVVPASGYAGEDVPLSVSLGSGYTEIQWTVAAGEVAANGEPDTTWTLPTDVAEFVAEDVAVSITATGEGCEDAAAEAVVSVDWADAARTMVIYNPSVDGSEDVATAYAAFRGVPHACPIAYADDTSVAGADWPAWVAEAQACLDNAGPQVRYVVPVYGVPYKVADRILSLSASWGIVTVSLDALLALGEASVDATETARNPLYRTGQSDEARYQPYLPVGELLEDLDEPRWLVTRIDGADAAAALDLVERAREAEELAAAGALDGVVYVDGNRGDTPPTTDSFGSYESGEWNMWGTRTVFEELGWYDVVWDGNSEEFGTAPAPTTCPDALYYAGWYSYNNYNDAFTWAPAAIGGHLDSCSACSLREQTWAAEALRRGITATFGAVNEPFVSGMPEYDQFFLYLTQGANYAEAAYESTVYERWMMVWVGDPLYRPYPAGSSASESEAAARSREESTGGAPSSSGHRMSRAGSSQRSARSEAASRGPESL